QLGHDLIRLCGSPHTEDSLPATRVKTFLPRSSSLSKSGFTSGGKGASASPPALAGAAASAGCAAGVFAQAARHQQTTDATPHAAARASTQRRSAGRMRRLGIETLRS